MKIEFAPLHIPLERRLQMTSVLQWLFCFLCMAQCSIALFILLLFTRFWLISALYALVKTADLDPSKNYIFGCHPHGVMSIGGIINFTTEATGFSKHFPGLKPHLMTLSVFFRAPFFRDYVMSLGVIPSSKESASYVLRKKE
ncbi:hypothetical protein Chor_010417, partial [Crotalus horridus]